MAKLPLGSKELKIGILGMTEGNGHPYSWSAMFNGFDPEKNGCLSLPCYSSVSGKAATP